MCARAVTPERSSGVASSMVAMDFLLEEGAG
jgi:hypothetical protein